MTRLPAIAAAAGLALLLAGCGSGPAPTGVATLPSPSGASAAGAHASASPTPASSDQTAQALAFSRCMRSNGVPNWPDPDSSGGFDKARIIQAVGTSLTSPQYHQYLAASAACQDLMPANMREPTQAEVQQEWTDDRDFAQCMRDAGLTNAPDPVADDHGRPYFDIAGTGIDPNSPRIQAMAQACQSQLHMATLPPVSGGG
jgi:hypothetical protein